MTFPLRMFPGLTLCLICLPPLTGLAQTQPSGSGYVPPTQATNQNPVQHPQPAATPQMPAGFPLSVEEQEYITKLVQYWEGASNEIRLYECDFVRWQYDHEICNYRIPGNNHLVAAVISKGKVRYSSPDKGMYQVNEMWTFEAPPETEGGDPKYSRPALENADFVEKEKWICDGTAFYEYDYRNKRLNETRLPPEVQGEGLKNSPLPFVFGARAAELLERFWIRDITPSRLQGEQYWLEAWPKRVTDAQAYQKVEIILSREPFLPVSVHMYAPNYNEKTNPAKMVFQFEKRQINGTLAKIAGFANNFISTGTPRGWERTNRKFVEDPQDQAAPRTGQLPGGQPRAAGTPQGR